MDGIIGLPDILDHFLDIFIDILESGKYRQGNLEDSLHLSELEDLERRYCDLELPWKEQLDEVPQEEQETEEPCSFTGPPYYLSKPHEDVILEYYAMFEEHIAQEWRTNKDLLDLLRSTEQFKSLYQQSGKG